MSLFRTAYLPWIASFYMLPWRIILWMFQALYFGSFCYYSLVYILIQSLGKLYKQLELNFSGKWSITEFLVQPLISWLIGVQISRVLPLLIAIQGKHLIKWVFPSWFCCVFLHWNMMKMYANESKKKSQRNLWFHTTYYSSEAYITFLTKLT